MSAKVVFGIAASEFMETDYLSDAPQVHLHFLTGPQEYQEQGFGRVELCCHGCGGALLVYYNDSADGARSHLKVTDEFAERHLRCQNRSFEKRCPPYRSSMGVVDLRTRNRALLEPLEVDEEPEPHRPAHRHRKPAAA